MELHKKILVLDTETVSVSKRYIYDLGYVVAELVEGKYQVIEQSQEIITQIYENRALFSTAYYANKRKRYTSLMRGRKAKKNKWGYALQKLKHVIKEHGIKQVYAYNSSFDERAVEFTSEFFQTQNTLKDLEWVDILAIANSYIHQSVEYSKYAMENGWVNPSGYLQTNAEKTYAYITNNPNYVEPHTSLQDVLIELDILNHTIGLGYKNDKDYKQKFLLSEKRQTFKLTANGKTYSFKYNKKINRKNGEVVLT